MYLLLNNNKYLDQIVNSLYFCLKKNDVSCKLVATVEKSDIKSEIIKEEKKDSDNKNSTINEIKPDDFKNFSSEDPMSLMKDIMNKPNKKLNFSNNNNLFDIAQNSKESIKNNSTKKKSIFDIAEDNNSSIGEFKEKKLNLNEFSMNKTIKSKNNEFDMEEFLKNPQEQEMKLPQTFNLSSIASESTGVANNFTSVEVNKTVKNDKEKDKINAVQEISSSFNLTPIKESLNTENVIVNNDEIVKKTVMKSDDIYIIFNINSFKDEDLPKKFIVYNFEQLTTDRKWDYSFFLKCKKALLILDYSLQNIKIFDQRDITAYHLPFGWCSVMEPSYNLKNKNIDLVFLGTLNKNRLNVITDVSLRNSKANIYIHNKCFKNDFEKVTCSSKVGMNIHYYDGNTILELTRIIPLICAGVIVVSERSNDIFYDKIFNKVIRFCKKEEISSVVKEEIYKYDLNKAMKKKKKLKKLLNFEKIVKENIGVFKKFI